MIFSGFPGIGKSYFFRDGHKIKVLDSDSSEFSWVKDKDGNNTRERNPEFPENYIKHIKENNNGDTIIFVSSHKVVRDALKDNGMKYFIIYPDKSLKSEYIERYKNRGSDEKFIKFISAHWDEFIDEIEEETYPIKIKLQSKETISTILN